MKDILVVEDNRLERKLIVHMLNEAFGSQIHVDECEDGEEAIDYLERNQYHLVITDLIMPRVEGIELIRRMKLSYPDAKVLAISGSNPYYLYLAKKLGIQGIFTKPLDYHKFIRLVSTSLTIFPDLNRVSA